MCENVISINLVGMNIIFLPFHEEVRMLNLTKEIKLNTEEVESAKEFISEFHSKLFYSISYETPGLKIDNSLLIWNYWY